MAQKLMRYNKTIIGKCLAHLHRSRPKGKRDGHLCQALTRKGNETGGIPSISWENGGYSLALVVCICLCSNPSSPFLILTSLNPLPLTHHPISSPLYTFIQSPLFLSLIYLLPCFPMCCLSLYRNKHTPELPHFDPTPSIKIRLRALWFAYMNLSLSILRHINHITPCNYESRQVYI